MRDLRPVIVETVSPVSRTKQQRLVAEWLWELIEPLLPPRPAPRGSGGRSRVDERAALEGILFVLHSGCRWRDLPPQLVYGSGHTAWWRLRGTWSALTGGPQVWGVMTRQGFSPAPDRPE